MMARIDPAQVEEIQRMEPVIPAKAGIHGRWGHYRHPWIPAFAGMTITRLGAVSSCLWSRRRSPAFSHFLNRSVIKFPKKEGTVMEPPNPVERLYAPMMAWWWLGVLSCLHVWSSFGVPAEPPPQRHLRLVSDRGKLVGE